MHQVRSRASTSENPYPCDSRDGRQRPYCANDGHTRTAILASDTFHRVARTPAAAMAM